MSRILTNLMKAERERREPQQREEAPLSPEDAERSAEAEALAAAGKAERERRAADEKHRIDAEMLELTQRRLAAEELAIHQAQAKSEAETAAEIVAAERAHAERLLEVAARSRVEAEDRALADAKRRELAAAELAKAAMARSKREQEAEALAKERAASERRAAELATEKIRDEQVAEAAAMARGAAERDAALQAERRVTQEMAARQAEAARHKAEAETGTAAVADRAVAASADSPFPIKVQTPSIKAPAVAERGLSQRSSTVTSMLIGAAAAIGVMIGLGIGLLADDRPWVSLKAGLRMSGSEAPLRLDRELQSLARASRIIPRDSK